MRTETIKDLISNELAFFLLNERVMPERIKIEVHYENSVAKLTIGEDKIKEFFKRGEAV